MDTSKIKQFLDSNVWIVYFLTFVIGCAASAFISLCEVPKEEQSIIFNPSTSIVVKDTIRIELILKSATIIQYTIKGRFMSR